MYTSCYFKILVAWCTLSFAPGSPTPNPRQGGCCAVQCGLERVWDPQLDWQVLLTSHRLLTMRGCSLVKEPLVAANIFSLHTPMGHILYNYIYIYILFYDILCGCINGRPMKSRPYMAKVRYERFVLMGMIHWAAASWRSTIDWKKSRAYKPAEDWLNWPLFSEGGASMTFLTTYHKHLVQQFKTLRNPWVVGNFPRPFWVGDSPRQLCSPCRWWPPASCPCRVPRDFLFSFRIARPQEIIVGYCWIFWVCM